MTILADQLPTASRLIPRPNRSPEALAPTSMPGTDLASTLTLLAEHGDELLRMAVLISGDNDVALRAVADALHGADHAFLAPLGHMDTRAVLASATYSACRVVPDAKVRATGSAHALMDRLAIASAQQRSVVALYLYGAQTMMQIASMLDLSTHAACLYLLSAADELAVAPV